MVEKIFDYLLILLFIFNFYLFINLILPPKIKIIYPDDTIVENNPVLIRGYVDPRSELFINAMPIFLNKNGFFEKEFYLKEGLNTFIFKAIKYWGQVSSVEKKIIFKKNEKSK